MQIHITILPLALAAAIVAFITLGLSAGIGLCTFRHRRRQTGQLPYVSYHHHQNEFYQHFIANISHELLTPLAAISGHTANIRELGQEEIGSRIASLDIIDREIRRLTTLTSNLLVLSRLESELPLRRELMNLGALIEEVVVNLRGQASINHIDITTDIASGLPRPCSDRDQLRRVFYNLVDNAIKHCPADTHVQIRLRDETDFLVAEVIDNGPGIPPEDLPYIFEKMYRVQKTGRRPMEGSGLGLAIVKRIVELHEGQIKVESVVNKGTRFIVRLPLKSK